MVTNRSTVGQRAEARAEKFLHKQGLRSVAKNYHCRWGELDLIMRDDNELVFVEVRYRKNQAFGGAAGSVAPHKQQKLARAALHYLSFVQKCLNTCCRFDVIAIHSMSTDNDPQTGSIEWLKNAIEIT